jgi:hypothetical protein
MIHQPWVHVGAVCFFVFLATQPRDGFMLLGLALAVSWLGDILNRVAFGGSFEGFYIWVPVQILLAFLAVEEGYRRRLLGVCVLLLLLPISIVMSYPGPEVLVMAVGSYAVVMLATGDLRWPVYLYFGASSALHVLMVWSLAAGNPVMTDEPAWFAYQGFRFAAFIVFVGLVLKKGDACGRLCS